MLSLKNLDPVLEIDLSGIMVCVVAAEDALAPKYTTLIQKYLLQQLLPLQQHLQRRWGQFGK